MSMLQSARAETSLPPLIAGERLDQLTFHERHTRRCPRTPGPSLSVESCISRRRCVGTTGC